MRTIDLTTSRVTMELFVSFTTLLLLSVAATSADEVSPLHEQALRFAPRLQFDQKQGNTLGECLPSDAEDFYALRHGGFQGKVCNMDYISVLEGSIPAYYMAEQCGTTMYFSYWIFYGYKDACPLGEDGSDVSWTRFDVKVLDGEILDRVIFYQHDGWYTRNPGRYSEFNGTHPIAHIGKLRHGAYHDDGGSGTCCYYEDYRNSGSVDKHMDTWLNLVWLRNDENAPTWMTDNEAYYWNGVTLPTFRGINLCDLRGCTGSNLQVCSTCGCHKSDSDRDEIP